MAGFTSLYDFTGLALEKARELVEHALKVKLHAHESLYHGGDYYRLGQEDVTLILQRIMTALTTKTSQSRSFPMSKFSYTWMDVSVQWSWKGSLLHVFRRQYSYGVTKRFYLDLRASPEFNIQTYKF